MPLKLLQVFSWVQCWPNGAQDKERALTGALMKCQERIATITSLWGCFMATDALSLTQTAVIARYISARWLLVFSSASLQYMQYCMVILDIKSMRLSFLSTLVTFRQPWHNCAINVTDSFVGSIWLVLCHNYITVHMKDVTCNSVQ